MQAGHCERCRDVAHDDPGLSGDTSAIGVQTRQMFHLKVRSVLIAAGLSPDPPTINAIKHFECHNPFLWRHNLL